jgi:hypothetical protein
MTRDAFLDGFTERLRNVLQKHERELAAKGVVTNSRVSSIWQAETNLNAAIDELGRFVLDLVNSAPVP